MGVFVRGRSMGGPTSVADAEGSVDRMRRHCPGQTFVNPAFFLSGVQSAAVEDRQAGTVVAAILEPAQALDDDWAGLLATDVAYDAAHKQLLSRGGTKVRCGDGPLPTS